ncbi:hypothetical protein LEP1GSC195_3048 [Leptospira wolbachii serovar Codice str. CDC]|uniref:Uncharacterized protein n=1 Tax=Leptospira wolbachii serovar Codice str. CDC TaxID=1218599 RepID=R9A5F4_9LEPT|nr:hypothetical protein [Leptospira wolbachii]EOQ95480.1 hypothetical protein LEP1GSC195_3048 [Leptospira wolbachii serovar Codice str. CDC]
MKIKKIITVMEKIEKSLLGDIFSNKCPLLVMSLLLGDKIFGGKT